MSFPQLTAEEAAAQIQHGSTIGFSGFTPAGAAKAVPTALAAKARAEHEAGREFQVAVVTGASTGNSLDGELARANAISWRTPYQSNKDLRAQINSGQTKFFDMHLSVLQQQVRYGFLGKFHWAVVEACDVLPDGQIVLSTSVGAANTFLQQADKVIIELNRYHPSALFGFHDIYNVQDPPNRRELPIYSCSDRVGAPVVKVDPRKIVGIVETNLPDEVAAFTAPDPTTLKIGENVAEFLAGEIKSGRVPKQFLPIQSGVGNIANAVLGAMGSNDEIPPFEMYSEVIQDSVIELIKSNRIRFASGTSMTVCEEVLKDIYSNLDTFRSRLLLRPQEVSNNPEVIRRIGIISVNTAIEVDVFGNVNSTHVLGRNMMNGIGGSGDFTRNAYISIFTCPSVAKGGKISTIVPLVSHMDHSEHSVQAVVTEQGIADLRGKDPMERAHTIVENCAHPEYKEQLNAYLDQVEAVGHTPQTLDNAFAMHIALAKEGDMRSARFEVLASS